MAACEGQGQFSTVPGHQHYLRQELTPGTLKWLLVVTRASDINTDPGCSRIIDPDMQHGPGCHQGLRLVCVPHIPGLKAPDINMVSGIAQTTDIWMAFGGNAGHRREYRPRLQYCHGPRYVKASPWPQICLVLTTV